MPTITLMRHGLPDAPAGKWLTAHGFADWVRRYDAAPVTPACPPPAAALEQARPYGAVVCSDLPRSLSSAALLGVRPAQAEALLREAALPTPAARWPLLRLPASAWAALARLAWLAGIACGRESLAAANRSRKPACAPRKPPSGWPRWRRGMAPCFWWGMAFSTACWPISSSAKTPMRAGTGLSACCAMTAPPPALPEAKA